MAVSSGLPFSRPLAPVEAIIVTPPVMSVPELVIHFFEPFMTHSPSSSSSGGPGAAGVGSGLVFRKPESPKFIATLNHTHRGSALSVLWVPKAAIGAQPRDMWASIVIPTEVSARQISSSARL